MTRIHHSSFGWREVEDASAQNYWDTVWLATQPIVTWWFATLRACFDLSGLLDRLAGQRTDLGKVRRSQHNETLVSPLARHRQHGDGSSVPDCT